jgi:hypothetical protein
MEPRLGLGGMNTVGGFVVIDMLTGDPLVESSVPELPLVVEEGDDGSTVINDLINNSCLSICSIRLCT